MKQYRGYNIDGIVVTETDIDNLIEAQNPAKKAEEIKRMQFFTNRAVIAETNAERMTCNIEAQKSAAYLHKYCGMTLQEIEAVKFAA